MTRASGPRLSGGPTQHIAVPASENEVEQHSTPQIPTRTDGKKTRSERLGSTDVAAVQVTPYEWKDKPPKRRTRYNARLTGLMLIICVALGGLVYFHIINMWYLAIDANALLLCIPSLMAYFKRRDGKDNAIEGIVPKQGGRGLFWKLIGEDLFAISGKSRLKAPSLRDRENQALDSLWNLRHVMKILSFANSKGGSGKTPVCVWLACLLAWAIKQPPLALDVNENPNHTATWLGVDPSKTLQLRVFLKACLSDGMETAAKLLSLTEWHKQTGTRVIAAEATSLQTFTPEQVIDGIEVAKAHNHSVFCDLGNGIITSGNWGAVAMSDTLVFCGNVNTANSENDVRSTMERYTELGHEQQVQHSIIVILGAKPEDRQTYADRYLHPVEQVFVIPFNAYMAKGNPVDIFKIPRRIRVILLEILVAVMQAESVARGSIDRSKVQELTIENEAEPDTVIPDDGDSAPSGATAVTVG